MTLASNGRRWWSKPFLGRARRPYLPFFLALWVLWTWVSISGGLSPLSYSDSRAYLYTAESLLSEGRFLENSNTGSVPTTWRPPMTALFYAALRAAGFTAEGIAYLQHAMAGLTAMLLASAAMHLGAARWAAWCAAVLYLMAPPVRVMAGKLMSENLFLLLLCLALWLGLAAGDGKTPERHRPLLLLAAGAALALAVLTRSVGLAAVPGVAALSARQGPGPWRAKALALVAAGLLVIMAPWWIRNWRVNGQFVLVNTAGSYNFYIGNVHDTDVLTDPVDRRRIEQLRQENTEVQVAGILRRDAWRRIASAPSDTLIRWTRNAGRFWTQSPPVGRAERAFSVLLQAVLLLPVVAACARPRRDPILTALASIPLLVCMLHVVTFTSWRFWLPVLPPCLLLAVRLEVVLINNSRPMAQEAGR